MFASLLLLSLIVTDGPLGAFVNARVHTAFAEGDEAMLDCLCESGPHAGKRLSARSVKFYADVALGSRGAALLEDCSDDPGNSGPLFVSNGQMRSQVDRAVGCGLQVDIHLALGSDFPVEPVNPWLGVHAAVTRQRDCLPPGGWQSASKPTSSSWMPIPSHSSHPIWPISKCSRPSWAGRPSPFGGLREPQMNCICVNLRFEYY